MYEKNSEKIQHVGHIFRLHVYYRLSKIRRNSSYNARIYVLYFVGSLFRHNVLYKVNLNN